LSFARTSERRRRRQGGGQGETRECVAAALASGCRCLEKRLSQRRRIAEAAEHMVSVETRSSWLVAAAALAILSISFGAPYVTVVALDRIATEIGGTRSVPALSGSLAWLGSGVGGLVMGRVAERVGVRWTVIFGGLMIAAGLAVSSGGEVWQLYIGHGLLIGFLGNGGINAPLYIYVSRWFDRRRGTALALIASGPYVAGTVWPSIFGQLIAHFGWRQTMIMFAGLALATLLPIAFLFLRPPPEVPAGSAAAAGLLASRPIRALGPNTVQTLLSIAAVLCCIPMAMPQGHLIAFCGDLGIAATRGAAMLSLLLACAFISRQFWGWLSDRIGGLRTILICSCLQAVSFTAFLFTQDELGLFLVSAAFGLGFSGIIPAYAMSARELFPASEASWRIPILLMCTATGMAVGGWLAGAMYDHFGFYAPAFATGIGLNLINILIIGGLVALQRAAGQGARS
jgi:MFS family permease